MIVVSNTSPITNLATVGHLELLRVLYAEIFIPEAVYTEVAVGGAGRPGAHEVATYTWIHRRATTQPALVTALTLELDHGEAEALVLAVELGADLVLLDERRGRHAATKLSLKPIGILGVLLEAKRAGHLVHVRPLLDALRNDAGFWIADDLYAEVLRAAAE